jgi:hypothetical protein
MARAISTILTLTFEADLVGDNIRIDDKSVIGRTFKHVGFRQSVQIIYDDGSRRELDPAEYSIGIAGDECEAIQRSLAENVLPLLTGDAA